MEDHPDDRSALLKTTTSPSYLHYVNNLLTKDHPSDSVKTIFAWFSGCS